MKIIILGGEGKMTDKTQYVISVFPADKRKFQKLVKDEQKTAGQLFQELILNYESSKQTAHKLAG